MSQRIVSQINEKTCEGCGATLTYDMAKLSDEQVIALSRWFRVLREFQIRGEWSKTAFDTCSAECVKPANDKFNAGLETLRQELEQEPSDDIDLDALRAPMLKN